MKLRLATKFTLFISTLLVLVSCIVLLGITLLSKPQIDLFQQELTRSFTDAKIVDYEKELHVHAQYLNRQLFNPLFNMNVSELNHEIKKVRVWLPVEQFLILDDQNRILTDGSVENSRYGETIPVAVQLLQQKQQILLHEDSIELNIAIHSGDDIRGYALMTLNNQVFLNSIARLTGDLEKMKSHLFHSMWTVFLAILLLTFLLGIFFSRLLSQYLSRPLSEMSAAAEQFAKGNLAYPLPEYSDDELGELARSLNTMATDLQMREGQLDALINNSTAIIYIKDIQGHFLLVNKHFQRLFHISQEEIRGKTDYDLFPAELADVFQANDQGVCEHNAAIHFEEQVLQDDGLHTYVSVKFPLYLANGEIYATCGVSTDISERKQWEEKLRKSEQHLATTLDSIGDGVIVTDAGRRVTRINPVAVQLTGWSREEAIGQPIQKIFRIIDERNRTRLTLPIERCIDEKKIIGLANHTILIRRDGQEIAIEDSLAPICHEQGNVEGVVLVFHDVTQARNLAAILSHQAKHDALTGLINRREFELRVEAAQQGAMERNAQHSMLYIDLDQFKIVNDTSGHVAGDELLKQVSSLLHAELREGDTLARLGGDEFGVLLENCPLEKSCEIAEQLRSKLTAFQFVWQDLTFNINCSIGVASINRLSGSLSDILSAADLACIAAKDHGRNRIHVADREDDEFLQRRGEMRWLPRLQKALENDDFQLYCQQIAPCRAGPQPLQRLEILLRLKDNGRIIPPGAFIPAAERYNLMPQLDKWVIGRVFSFVQRQPASAVSKYAINISGSSVSDPALITYILQQSARFKIPAETICFEITETAAIANLSNATQLIKTLKTEGFRFALDDFGSGLSSFAYLKSLPVDYLKIDGMFIKDIKDDPLDYTMVKSINEIGHAMGIATIAEYVENKETFELLKTIGVDYVQGYHIHRPQRLSENVVEKLIKT